ncbi:hypothetical protein ACS0TY_002001 [Phlomoides rotata]
MEAAGKAQKPHAICTPFPAQGHINPMYKLAIILHHKGFHITFVLTDYNHKRLLQSLGTAALNPPPDFQFATIPDGLPPLESGGTANSTQDIRSLCVSITDNCLAPLNELIDKLNHQTRCAPPVSCVIADTIMTFALDAAERIGVPGVLLQTAGACSFMCNKHIRHLIEKGIVPLKDESCLTNGYLEIPIDWIPGVIPLRLRHFSSVIRTTDPNDSLLNFLPTQLARSSKAAAIIMNTFDSLEHSVLSALSLICPPICTLGPLHLIVNQLPGNKNLKWMSSSLWKEDSSCLKWLDSKPQNSVLYVNFGSITVLNPRQLCEFAWGLAKSKKNFVWIVRPDLFEGGSRALSLDFLEEIRDRGIVAEWCPQEEVLSHWAIGGFLTHCGWNSVLESMCNGVPMLCWPFFADQHLNCKYACEEWGVGMEIKSDVERDEVRALVSELMDGERGKMLRKRAVEWQEKAAAAVGGSSCLNLDKLVNEILCV